MRSVDLHLGINYGVEIRRNLALHPDLPYSSRGEGYEDVKEIGDA